MGEGAQVQMRVVVEGLAPVVGRSGALSVMVHLAGEGVEVEVRLLEVVRR